MRRYLLLPSALPLLLITLQLQQQPAVAPPPAPSVTTAPCPQLDGLKCSNLGPTALLVAEALPCPLDENGMPTEACRRRREQAQISSVGSADDCAGSAYASKDAEGRWYCGAAGDCAEWVAAAGWTTFALDGVGRVCCGCCMLYAVCQPSLLLLSPRYTYLPTYLTPCTQPTQPQLTNRTPAPPCPRRTAPSP